MNLSNLRDHLPEITSKTREILNSLPELTTQAKNIVDHLPEISDKAQGVARRFSFIKSGLKFLGKSDKTEILSIGTFLERNAAEYPHRTALLFEEQRYTHYEFNAAINRYAHYFISKGLKKGDAVTVFMENRPEILICTGALAKIGAITALINTTQRSNALIHSFTLSNPKLFVIGEELVEAFQEVKTELKPGEGTLFFVKDKGDHAAPEGFIDLADVTREMASHNPGTTKTVQLGDPCYYIYTSGTTGLPKASIMTHYRWVKAAGAFGMAALAMKPEDTIYVSLPFYHNNALTVAWSSAASGGSAIAIRRKFSASNFWDDTRKFNATAFCYIGELCRYLMNQPVKPDDANNPVYKIIGNGLRPDIWKGFKQRFGITEVYEFYAASEANIAFVNLLNLDETIGLCPAPYAIVKYDIDRDEPVKDEDGYLIKVKRGEIGLLLGEVSAKYGFDGYTNKEASEKKLMRNVFKAGDVWFNSGDLLKDQGFRHAQFADRLGDTFRWQGENVSTTEVSEVITVSNQVAEATVYGVEIPGTDGRAGMASLVLSVPVKDLDLDELLKLMTQNLSAYAIPRFIRVQEELAITGTFKHQKGQLKKEGYDLSLIKDPIFVLLPKTDKYVRLTRKIYNEIQEKEYRF
ncbi:MAG: long-chain-acyl-CoA synthetase [SAR324 cluster bacterium]|nr:long-chain-acyl-CoA synthetase [SAR324 cluster bacterium]